MRFVVAILIAACLCTASLAVNREARAAFTQGVTLLNKGQYVPAINTLKLALQDYSFPLQDYSYYYIAQAYAKSGYAKEALQVYEIVVKYFPDSVLAPKALLEMAQCQSEVKNYQQANISLRGLLNRYPNHELAPLAQYSVGLNLEQLGQFAAAARVYRNVDLDYPRSDLAEKALERLDFLAERSPLPIYEAPAATIYNLGMRYFDDGNYKKAKGYFDRLAKFYKKSTFHEEALIMLGRISLRQNKLSKAAKYFKTVSQTGSAAKPEALFYLALTYDYRDDDRSAINLLEKVAVNYPKAEIADDALFYLGRFYLATGNSTAALGAYRRLLANYPYSEFLAETIWLTGNLYYRRGDYAEANRNFKQAFKLAPNKASDKLLFWAGKSAAKMDNTLEAVGAYKLTISRYDHSYYAYRAREELKKYAINIRAEAVPAVADSPDSLNSQQAELIYHEQKYKELLALGLEEAAADEAAYLVDRVPSNKKELAALAKYHAYISRGKYVKPISFANKKIEEATYSGSLAQLDPHLWRMSYPRGYWAYVEEAAKQYHLDPFLVYAVIREESHFNPQALSRSRAHGLMQIMPGTGRLICQDLGLRYSRSSLYNPRRNIELGSYYLAAMIREFNGNVPLALASYNGGPHRVEKWLAQYDSNYDLDEFVENIPLRETRNYVKKVMKSYYGYKRTYANG